MCRGEGWVGAEVGGAHSGRLPSPTSHLLHSFLYLQRLKLGLLLLLLSSGLVWRRVERCGLGG